MISYLCFSDRAAPVGFTTQSAVRPTAQLYRRPAEPALSEHEGQPAAHRPPAPARAALTDQAQPPVPGALQLPQHRPCPGDAQPTLAALQSVDLTLTLCHTHTHRVVSCSEYSRNTPAM